MSVSKEITKYPETNTILYTDSRRSYRYTVIQEGFYPQPPVLAYTQGKEKYKIPDNYRIETIWGRCKKQRTIQCFINYVENKPVFKITYGPNLSRKVQSNTSSTEAANSVIKSLFPLKKSKISGVHLFGLHLQTLKQARECCHRHSVLKPLDLCSNSTINKRQHKFGEQLQRLAHNEGTKVYGEDNVALKQLSYTVNDLGFQINYGSENAREKIAKFTSIVQAIDENHISRNGYRALAAIEPHLEREWAVSDRRLKLTKDMNQKVPITFIDLPVQGELDPMETADISDPEVIQEVIHSVGKGGYRSVKAILIYIVPALIIDGVLDGSNPTIHLRVSGDGRNVGRKVKHVMVTIAILDDEQNIHIPDRHYTTLLFPGVENYETLEVMMAPFIQELDDLKSNGLKINETQWNFEFYFSSDWKFLAICLGFNAPNSNYYCPWCQVSKRDQVNFDDYINWTIDKKMEKINESLSTYPGHNKKPLFDMIPLDRWVPDELHIMLRVWDRLWTLFLTELRESDQFDDVCRDEIIQEMDCIGVRLQFWKERNNDIWNYTSLMGEDKLKVLRNFNFERILPLSRARKIRELWNRFNQIYLALKTKNYDPQRFQVEAKEWLELFLTPDKMIPNSTRIEKGLYGPSAITPYMHVLVNHISEFMEKHQRWGIQLFSCAAVEKKNHQHVSHFFQQTLKDGGKPGRKSAIADILEYENRILFYLFDNTIILTSKPKKIRIA